MEVRIVQEKTLEQMLSKVALLRQRFTAVAKPKQRGLEEWMDSQDVCQLLHISSRTLQTLRTNGEIAYSQVGGKFYYHKNVVQKLAEKRSVK